MRIKTFGSRYLLAQIDRIDQGFRDLDHELVEENPELIYCNDAGHHLQALEFKKKWPQAKLILNILDLPFHCKEIDDIILNLSIILPQADYITTISHTVAMQMFQCIPSTQQKGVSVIYQPIKPVYPLNLQRNDRLLMVGRLNDPNKRFNVALEVASLSNKIIDVVGPEDPTPFAKPHYRKFINYLGIIDDERLNIEYNSHSAVLITGKIEGLCLPLIESLAVKTPVLVCEDMTTATEFAPKEFISHVNLFDLNQKLEYVVSGCDKVKEILDIYSEKYIKRFAPYRIAQNIVDLYEKQKRTN